MEQGGTIGGETAAIIRRKGAAAQKKKNSFAGEPRTGNRCGSRPTSEGAGKLGRNSMASPGRRPVRRYCDRL